ncbi:sigma-70 family RNA polymerase sigma factor [Plastoroseomonas hellenica]
MPPEPVPPMEEAALAAFQALRPRLQRLAHRMLGSAAEAEDAVQEAWLRWDRTDPATVREPAAFLTRVVTRLCLDQLKSARARRETYIGPWLPEPVLEPVEEEAEDLTTTLLLALERLTPLERAAFLLHDVFGLGFEEVARTIDRDPAACRQLASRARGHVREARPRHPVAEAEGQAIADAFFHASRNGDLATLRTLLADGVILHADGGGKRPALLHVLEGLEKVAHFFEGLAKKGLYNLGVPPLHRGLVDGLPGYVTLEKDGVPQTTALAIEDGRIVAIYTMRNPDKLGSVALRLMGAGA